MATSYTSSNMRLTIPVVGQELGPQWANDLNSSLTAVDAHDHSTGKGVLITPIGLNISSDLTMGINNLTNARSIRFNPYASSGAFNAQSLDIGCLFEITPDLYYRDGNGNSVRITQSGAVAGTPGSISNLVSPASAAYVGANSTFVWQSAANIAANLDCGSILMRNLSPNSTYALTLAPPSALNANYSITLPRLPVTSGNFLTIDTSGNVSSAIALDNSTITVNDNVLQVSSQGITATQIANSTITTSQLAASVLALLVPSGSISAYGGISAPTGWLMCDGTSYLKATYPGLFSVIGTAYGSADGLHFNVPDLRGQFLRGVAGSATTDPDKALRTATTIGGNSGNNVGSGQTGEFTSHSHNTQTYVTSIAFDTSNLDLEAGSNRRVFSGSGTNSSGGNETRPINIYVNFIIKV